MPSRFVITSFEDEGFHNATWQFDVGKMKLQQGMIWHRHTRTMYRPTIIRGRELMYVGDFNQVKLIDKVDSIASEAKWQSPQLNRGDRQAEYSLTRVLLRYECAADTHLTLWGTGDGGETWPDPFKVTVDLTQTVGRVRRAIQTMYTTGTDVRFCINFPDDALVLIRGWSAEIMKRGRIGGLD